MVVNRILRQLTPAEIAGGNYNTGIKRNTIYSISVVIKNKGVDNPYIIIDPGYLIITLEPQDWLLTIDQPVDF